MDTTEQKRRLEAIRVKMNQYQLAMFLVPRADEHQLEYVPPSSERLAWISGFTGSAGMAVVGRAQAALFVDGRYTLQARQQATPDCWEHHHLIEDPAEKWIAEKINKGDRVGFDPRLHTPEGLKRFEDAIGRAGGVMYPLESNPIDELWPDRPAPPTGAIEIYPDSLAGESSVLKRHRMAEELKRAKVDALVISAPDSLAWLFNIRGSDLDLTPFALGFAILRADGTASLFLDSAKVSDAVRQSLKAQSNGAILLAEPASLYASLDELAGQRVRVDKATGSIQIVERLKKAGASVDVGDDPCALAKACKNSAELSGIRAAHVRDGVALVRFMSWFARNAPGNETESSLADRIDDLRSKTEHFRTLSFNTISAAGPNAALCHYKFEKETARALKQDEIYLIDSGGQYIDGTTDVTRTLITGKPTAEMKRRYTQVLKGHIALAVARFPKGTTGSQLDALARQYLWQDGVDYDHGTGHGVGHFLSVHEGPQVIAKRPSTVGLEPGMVLSDEPGYYKTDGFGIRIENLVAVKVLDPQPNGAENTFLGFEVLTLAPYERNLIDVSFLTESERAWVDAYHARVRETLTPHLDEADAAFLAEATKPLG
jgi:Xaa-Pro aminopeptidase